MKQIMDHSIAESTNAVERYLLEETTPEERSAFEEHLFDCPLCAEDVRNGAVFFDNARQVLKEETLKEEQSNERKPWNLFAWLQPAVLAPSFAAIALAAVVGYQNFVTLPALLRPQLLTTTAIAPLSRGVDQDIRIDRSRAMFNANFSIDSPRAYPSYVCTLESADGVKIFAMNTEEQKYSSFTLSVLLPASKFPTGTYSMTLRPTSDPGMTVGRYTFTVRDRVDGNGANH